MTSLRCSFSTLFLSFCLSLSLYLSISFNGLLQVGRDSFLESAPLGRLSGLPALQEQTVVHRTISKPVKVKRLDRQLSTARSGRIKLLCLLQVSSPASMSEALRTEEHHFPEHWYSPVLHRPMLQMEPWQQQ